MDNKIQEKLNEMYTAKGFKKYGALMAAKFGGEAADYAPYLLAVALEITWINMEDMLDSIREAPSLAVGLFQAKGVQIMTMELMLAAGEAVGAGRMEQIASELGTASGETEVVMPTNVEVH